MIDKTKLFIFDMDGTLVDTERLYMKSLMKACGARGFKLDLSSSSKMVYGKAWTSVFEDVDGLKPNLFESSKELEKDCAIYFDEYIKNYTPAIASSVSLLKELAQDNPVCIVSGSSRQHIAHFIDKLEIKNEVDFYLGNEDYKIGKPHPECYLKAALKMKVDTKDCVVFEDSTAGVSAAKSSEMFCVAFKNEDNPQDLSHADLVLTCLSQFSSMSTI